MVIDLLVITMVDTENDHPGFCCRLGVHCEERQRAGPPRVVQTQGAAA